MPPPDLPLLARARAHGVRPAVAAGDGTHTCAGLLSAAERVAAALLAGERDLGEARVAFLLAPGGVWVAVQWGIWLAGGIAVPLATSHPASELAYVLDDADAAVVIADGASAPLLAPLAASSGRRFVTADEALGHAPAPLPPVGEGRRALMVYTSGTTGRPKGAVTTHRGLRAQIESLIEAWAWSPDDRTLLVLPLHHVHGIVNVVGCALRAGALCEMHARFDTVATWEALGAGRLTVFMAVPTVYARLIAAWEAADLPTRRRWSEGAAAARLMVSGSAALPVATLERWREITGHTLLERYGMTEIGMALSNPLHGERRPGHVGSPLPGVEVRLVDDAGAESRPGSPGEIEVRGPTVFLEYWDRPDATAAAFRDGWFRTGDVAVLEEGSYRILGRSSVDILKTGGFKVSALEIEEVLRTHPAIDACAVVGVDDPEWGQRVSVAVEVRGGAPLDAEALRGWAAERLAPYKIPRAVRVVDALPRNAMGKVLKPEVARLFG
jgi:malonyl-CoA/methylmalonyl-CoA synthetase